MVGMSGRGNSMCKVLGHKKTTQGMVGGSMLLEQREEIQICTSL